MKILILSDVNSAHTVKWVDGLLEAGLEVFLFSLTPDREGKYTARSRAGEMHLLCMDYGTRQNTNLKALYLSAVPKVRRAIRRFRPDIVHAHYASSYGLIGALAVRGKKVPYVVSVWGSDVYEFPFRGRIAEKVLTSSLNRADAVCSTSRAMTDHTRQFTRTPIHTIPFGIDLRRYSSPAQRPRVVLRFATAKSLAPVYNLATVVEAFIRLRRTHPRRQMELHIAGEGPLREELRQMAESCDAIQFHGRIPPDRMPDFYADKHVLLNPSLRESFGVSVLEASAAGMAVVVTDVGGLPEVVDPGSSGFLLPQPTTDEVFKAMSHFAEDPSRAIVMGDNGREFVSRHYDFQKNLENQIALYRSLLP